MNNSDYFNDFEWTVEQGQAFVTAEDVRNGTTEPAAAAGHGTHENVCPAQTGSRTRKCQTVVK